MMYWLLCLWLIADIIPEAEAERILPVRSHREPTIQATPPGDHDGVTGRYDDVDMMRTSDFISDIRPYHVAHPREKYLNNRGKYSRILDLPSDVPDNFRSRREESAPTDDDEDSDISSDNGSDVIDSDLGDGDSFLDRMQADYIVPGLMTSAKGKGGVASKLRKNRKRLQGNNKVDWSEYSNEYRVKHKLLMYYDKTSRPVKNDSTTVDVYIGMSLYHILDTVSTQCLDTGYVRYSDIPL